MSLRVDVPKAGFGNTNDSNISRRFFMEHELSAKIFGIDSRLLYRLKEILETIARGQKIYNVKFILFRHSKTVCETIFLASNDAYSPQNVIPQTHCQKNLLSISIMSEEARKKHFRVYRLRNARKFIREVCNRDVIC